MGSLYPLSLFNGTRLVWNWENPEKEKQLLLSSSENWRNYNYFSILFFFLSGSVARGLFHSEAAEPHINIPNMEDNTEDLKDCQKGSQRLS